MLRHRRQSSEAALKYAVFGAGTAGVMLYGISLLVGVLGSAHLPTMAAQLAEMLARTAGAADRTMVLVLGGLMVMVGLAFKLSAVPFHFWAARRVRGRHGRGGRLPVGRLEGRRAGAVGPAGDRLRLRRADSAQLAALAPARQYHRPG